MMNFQAAGFFLVWEDLAYILAWIKDNLDRTKLNRLHSFSFNSDTSIRFWNTLSKLQQHCADLGLNTPAAKINWINQQHQLRPNRSWQELINDLDELKEQIMNELQQHHTFMIERPKTEFYDLANILGRTILDKVPDSAADIDEAGKCFALGRWTASVFHLMRVMEHGVQQFANMLGVTIKTNDTWGQILNAIDPAVKKMPTQTQQQIELQHKYQGLKASLHAVKDAWRNPTMHPQATYTEVETLEIINAVRTFLRRLADVL
jgi:hypothetical protein